MFLTDETPCVPIYLLYVIKMCLDSADPSILCASCLCTMLYNTYYLQGTYPCSDTTNVTPQPGYLYRSIPIWVSRPVTVTTLSYSCLTYLWHYYGSVFFFSSEYTITHVYKNYNSSIYIYRFIYNIIQYSWTHNILYGYKLYIRH